MNEDFDIILDKCIDRINRGEGIEACLADYPDSADQLRPALQAMSQTIGAYSLVPSPDAKKAARQRFETAMADLARRRQSRRPRFAWFHGWSGVWATSAAVLVIALVTYLAIRPPWLPGEPLPQAGPPPVTSSSQTGPPPMVTVLQPNRDGNFVFLISDDVNAIGDFSSVMVSIAKVTLQRSGDSNQTIEFEPEVNEVDLTLVQGEKSQEIWRGDIPAGEYANILIDVSDVRGVLKATGEEIEIKLPGQKLHISKPFEVSTEAVTSFTSDLTVVAAGNDQSGIKYILKPQIDQSGAVNKPVGTHGQQKQDAAKPE